jgi:hypothetical protein
MARQNLEKLLEKWEPMIAHLKSEKKQILTAQLLENEEKYFNKEMLNESGGGTSSEVGAGCGDGTVNPAINANQGIAKYMSIAMPLVARVFPELITNDLVGVQPMFTPVSLAYAMRFRYQTGAAAGVEAVIILCILNIVVAIAQLALLLMPQLLNMVVKMVASLQVSLH